MIEAGEQMRSFWFQLKTMETFRLYDIFKAVGLSICDSNFVKIYSLLSK